MFLTVAQFVDLWKQEAKRTHEVFAALTDESLSQSAEAGGRSLARLAWHLTQTVPEMLHRTGLDVKGPSETEPPPASAAKIVADYDVAAQSALEQVEKSWTDANLNDLDEMYGEKWKRGETLMVLILHQVHHRGQMTILMREAGLRLPSFYGPVREDWAQWGMQPPAI
jgi:uncharacterized damage-inducible protein DinB